MNSYSELWEFICKSMQENKYITSVGYEMWLKESYIMECRDNVMYISTPTDFHKDVLVTTYREKLKECVSSIMGTLFDVEFVVNVDETRGIPDEIPKPQNQQFLIGSEYTFDNFVLGSSNRYAQAAALTVAENPATYYNPLLIYGASGVGKTHLMFAMRNHMIKNFPNKKIEYIRCEDFTNMFIESLQSGTISLFHNRFRSVDVLLIDDIQFIENKKETQEEFFNTFNSLLQSKKQIVLTSDRAPKDINNLDERMRSRFENGLLADISTPDLETRIGIIKEKSKVLEKPLDEDLIFFIADQVKGNSRQIEGIINQIQAYIHLHHSVPTITTVQNYIRNIVSNMKPDPVNVDRVINVVSESYQISEPDIRSKRRTAEIVWARHVAIYITSKVTDLPNMRIGKEFKMDHASIGHAIKKVEEKMKIDQYEKKHIEDIIGNLNHEKTQ